MAIEFDRFLRWAESRFDNILVKGKEIRLNSVFTPEPDTKRHLWCSPAGGKKKRPQGVYHCFKTDRKGSLIKLVMEVDGCDRNEAEAVLLGTPSIRMIEEQLEDFFRKQDEGTVIVVKPFQGIDLPPSCYRIGAMSPSSWWRVKAEEYLAGRHIPSAGLYICTEGKYKARVIIPYYSREGTLVYWNARHIGHAKQRYIGPPKEVGIGKEDVIYMESWPSDGAMIHLCEGEFNAKSLAVAGLNGAACGGKSMSEKQAVLLKGYRIVICLDRDNPGWKGSSSMSDKLSSITLQMRAQGYPSLLLTRPPEGFKDWNKMLVDVGPNILHEYIIQSARPLEQNAPHGTASDYFRYRDL